MADLTVGYVSGIIAAGVSVGDPISYTNRNHTYISRAARRREHIGNMVTAFSPFTLKSILRGLRVLTSARTQIGKALHASHWPFLLRADSSTIRVVNRAVKLEGIIRPLILLIIGVAAIVTPLGLYDAIVPGTSAVPQPFKYQNDMSPLGVGTPPRSSIGFNRQCGSYVPVVCPGSKTIINTSRKGDNFTFDLPNSYDMAIPNNLSEIFQSGLKDMPPTVSSIFDIQWRSYGINIDEMKNNGSAYLVGAYKQIDNLLLRDGYMVVEGLIVDNKNGGIGFRNHTIPSAYLKYGGSWSEDLLFIEPLTKCVDTNITVDFTIPDNSANSSMNDVKLTDRGGFSKLNTTYPQYDRGDPQKDPDLYGRAYKAAYLHNAYTMLLLNVTNPRTASLKPWSYLDSTEGKTFPIDIFFSNLQPNQLGAHKDWLLWDGVSYGGALSNLSSSSKVKYPNPYKVTKTNFTSISTLCQGAGSLDLANITNIGVGCGLIAGAARRADGNFALVAEPRSQWTVPLYSCASATRAVVKTVEFRYNGTDGLKSLSVVGVREKVYKQDSDKPFWGVERPNIKMQDIAAMWGLVSDRYKNRDEISVIQSKELWLPGFIGDKISPSVTYMNLPGVSFYIDALASIYTMSDPPAINTLGDYTGRSNLAMYARWQQLSKHANTTSTIINQIWTDITANAVVGTRGWTKEGESDLHKRAEGDKSPPQGKSVNVPVNVYRHQVKYRIAYGIPAFISLALAIVVMASSCVLCLVGRARPSVVRRHLYHTAPGRILGTFMYPGQVDQQAPTKGWNEAVGSKKVSLAGSMPHPSDPIMMAPYSNTSRTNMDSPLLQQKEGAFATVHPLQMNQQQSYHGPQ
ncbi:hypothetical protein PRK78_001355 [Emydomyces testavorans]|uniref:Uncharacterized protein n=1 Tax=Emydomyces testavorans TaxID=2070801 RepID=A0AAF0DCR4_9EURO|nr:hypothetical protein PRK78_001355 [Emydomyces testavorans]